MTRLTLGAVLLGLAVSAFAIPATASARASEGRDGPRAQASLVDVVALAYARSLVAAGLECRARRNREAIVIGIKVTRCLRVLPPADCQLARKNTKRQAFCFAKFKLEILTFKAPRGVPSSHFQTWHAKVYVQLVKDTFVEQISPWVRVD